MKMEVLTKKEMLTAARKQWTLDEEGDDEEEAVPADAKATAPGELPAETETAAAPNSVVTPMEEDDEDPLDAFMKGVQEEVRKMNTGGHSTPAGPKGTVQKVVVVKSGNLKKAEKKDKGELIEQNMDGLEVILMLSA